MLEIFIATLGTYGVATLVSDYDGAFGIFKRLRKLGEVFECNICLTPWIALPIAYLAGLSFVEYLAVIGLVIIIERFYDRLF